MIRETELQRDFWNRNAIGFDSIYSERRQWVKRAFDKVFRKDMYDRFRFAMESSAPVAAKRVLDLGCGTGHYSFAFAREGAREVHGIDISDRMIEICRERAERHALGETCRFFLGDPLQMDLERKYDVTIGIGLFDYIREPLPLIRWMKSRTAGKIIVSFPRRFTWRAPLRKFRLWAKGCPVYFYSRKEVFSLLRRAGLKVLRFEKIGKLYCVLSLAD